MRRWFQKDDRNLEEKGAKKVLCADGASDRKRKRAVVGGNKKCEGEERTAVAFGGEEIGEKLEMVHIAGEAEEIAIGQFFGCGHGGFKFGKKGGFAFAQLGTGERTSDGKWWHWRVHKRERTL